MDPKLSERNQGIIHSLQSWPHGVVARTWAPTAIDTAKGVATPITLPGDPEILDVTGYGSASAALCRQGSRFYVALKGPSSSSWMDQPVPPGVKIDAQTPVRLVGDARDLVLWEPMGVHRFNAGTWMSATITGPIIGTNLVPKERLLDNGTLYLGESKGEWGGALYSIDISTGVSKREIDDPKSASGESLPVEGIAVGPDGHVWVARGLAHLGLREGTVHEKVGDQWKLVAGSTRNQAKGDWSLPLTSFEGLAFDPHGRLYVLTGSLGLVRHDGHQWTRVTPSWPEFVYSSGLAFDRDVAVIATYDAGLMLLDTKMGTTRHVVIPKGAK